MKKFLAITFGVLLLLAGCFTIWAKLPGVRDPDAVAAAIATSDKRFSKLKEQATSPLTNGYLQPELLNFWAPGQYPKNDPAARVLDAWAAYGSQSSGRSVDHRSLLKSKDHAYIKARGDFESLLGPLSSALEKPVFVPPEWTRSLDSETASLISLRHLASSLSAYSESLAAQGRHEEALANLHLGWRLGALQASQSEISLMVGISIQSLTSDTLLHLPRAQGSISKESWLALARALQESSFSPTLANQSLEDELARVIQFHKDATRGKFNQGNSSRNIPGTQLLMDRELRMAKNTIRMVQEASAGQPTIVLPPKVVNFTLSGWLAGGSSFMASVNLPNLQRASLLLYGTRAEMAGLSSCAALFAYRQQHGALPSRLQELESLGITASPGFPWESMTYEPPKLFIKLPAEVIGTRPGIKQDSPYTTVPWMTRTSEGLEFDLR